MTQEAERLVPPVSYWGEGGIYGPFEVQTEGEWTGWPHAGQVMRYFRKKAKLSAKAFGILYGREVNEDGSAVSERWMLEMELENKIPVDITKRKTIARLLKIPPILFGLATLEEVTLELRPHMLPIVAGQTHLQRVAVDTTKYQNNVHTIWQLHETSSAGSAFSQLYSDIQDLESLESQTQGDLRYHVQEMLLSDLILATHVVRDQRQFGEAYHYANEAVRVAKSTEDSDLIATALFTRGWTRLEWGMFGTIEQGMFQVQQDKIKGAIHDFQEALDLFPAQNNKERMHPQLLGVLTMEMSRAQAILAVAKSENISPSILIALDNVADTVDKQQIDDPYTRVLMRGSRTSWHESSYLNIRATVFNVAGLPGKALKELKTIEQLTAGIYSRDETRRFVWRDIQMANVYMGLGELGTATMYAKQALLACQDINSVTNIAIITDIYGRLLHSSHKASSEVKEMGDILRESPVSLNKHTS